MKRRCRPMLTTDHKYLVVLTGRTLCLHMCSRKTVKLIQKFSLQYKDSQQAAVKHSLLLEQLWLSHIAILHSWCSFRLSRNPCHFFFFFEIWICKSLGFQQFENRPLKKVQSRFEPRILLHFSVSGRVWACKAVFPCLMIFPLWRFTKVSNLLSFGLIKKFFQIIRTGSQLF